MKTKRTYTDYLRDMLEHAQKAERFLAGVSYRSFEENDEKIFAVLHALQIIGEATNRIPRVLRNRYSDLPWADIIGMRHILVHEYLGVDLKTVWNTVRRDLPVLRKVITRILQDLEQTEPDA